MRRPRQQQNRQQQNRQQQNRQQQNRQQQNRQQQNGQQQNRQQRRAPRPDQSVAAAALVSVRIEALATGGDAVGRQQGGAAEGRATFVALAAPGDLVQARLTRQKGRVAWGDLITIDHPSPHRVTPPCALFGRCGGCQWQHVDLETQRAAKREIVARALGLPDVPLIVPVANGRGYRERAQLVVGAPGVLGFRARHSHDVVDVAGCLLLAPALQRVLDTLRASGPPFGAGTEVDLLAGRAGVHVSIQLRGGASRLFGAAGGLTLPAAWREAGVVGLRVQAEVGGGDGPPRTVPTVRAVGDEDVDIDAAGIGAGTGIGQNDSGAPLRLPAGAFAQVGRAANQALMSVVLGEVGADPGMLLELYAGSGNFTRHLVDCAAHLVACDADRDAVLRGRRNAPRAVWLDRPPALIDADTVVVDPPRAGLDAENLRAAVQARRRIVYVSCDPQTLGRDAARLLGEGFVLRRAVALDLMPHTYHVEVVATFDRRQSPAGPGRPGQVGAGIRR